MAEPTDNLTAATDDCDVTLSQLEDKTHPAWQRLIAEELLAQQLSQLQARRERAAQARPA